MVCKTKILRWNSEASASCATPSVQSIPRDPMRLNISAPMRASLAIVGIFATMIALAGCGGSAAPLTPAERGRIVYMTNCVICHNADPNLPGEQGPAIAGSSRELVYDRVLFLTYPPGYTPKRPTHLMRALPQLVNRIDDLTAFLAESANQN
jgi:mono/diheme cytochrome c family protein